MVKAKRKGASAPVSLVVPKMPDSFADEVIGGCVAIGWSGRFYFEMSLTGYDTLKQSMADARLFFDSIVAGNRSRR